MKPFLGVDLTTNKKNEEGNGKEFLVASPSLALQESWNRSFANAQEKIEQSKLPLPLRVIQWICGFGGLLVFFGILRADVTFEQGYKNAPGLFWFCGIALVIWAILKIAGTVKKNKVLGTDESVYEFSYLERNGNAIYEELEVPANATEVDVLMFYYKMKNGEMKVCEKGMQIAPYLNPVFKIFADSENLYLANLEGKYAFPKSSIVTLHTIKKNIMVLSWNKDVPMNQEPYKQYKLDTNQYGSFRCKQYHILEISDDGESIGIYIPNYEMPVFEKYLK